MMELSEKLSQQGLPEMEEILLGEANPNIAFALEKALRRPVAIILDESQRFFVKDSGSPLPEWNAVLAHLRNRPTLPGRLLLLSDRMVEHARWSEAFPIRTLAKFEPEEALEVFDDRLQSGQVNEEIALERKQDLVRVLDYNPRAIEALVSALAYDTLDEIMGSNPGLWDVHDREVSREFLNKLERDLMERTMAHLDAAHHQRLLRLAVHRKSFKKQALEIVCGSKDASAELRVVLVARFLLNHYGGTFALNPIVPIAISATITSTRGRETAVPADGPRPVSVRSVIQLGMRVGLKHRAGAFARRTEKPHRPSFEDYPGLAGALVQIKGYLSAHLFFRIGRRPDLDADLRGAAVGGFVAMPGQELG
jgi:hypothetical protein